MPDLTIRASIRALERFVSDTTPVRELARALAQARSVAVLTGAGISAESGVPTFRGPGGLWEGHRGESLATPEAFERDPVLVWRFYDWRRTELAHCEPNDGHRALVAIETRVPVFTLATQNVDGLHQRAGSKNVLELHGNIWRIRCDRECSDQLDMRAPLPPPLPPRCPRCLGPLRPGVVWFGESLPWDLFEQAELAARGCDVFLVVGTSGVVEPAASLARVASHLGAFVAEINPEATPLSAFANVTLRDGAGASLRAVVHALEDA